MKITWPCPIQTQGRSRNTGREAHEGEPWMLKAGPGKVCRSHIGLHFQNFQIIISRVGPEHVHL